MKATFEIDLRDSDPTPFGIAVKADHVRKRNPESDDSLFYNVQNLDCYESFSKLFKFYYNQVLLFSRKYVKNTESAEEVINDVFLKLWNKRRSIKLTGAFKSYLYSSVRNKCIDYLRKQNDAKYESEQALDHVESSHSNTIEIIQCQELQDKIDQTIDLLPQERRRIFELSRREGLMYKEIAVRLGISIKTVETQMGRSLKFLREHLTDELTEFYGK